MDRTSMQNTLKVLILMFKKSWIVYAKLTEKIRCMHIEN